MNSWIIEANLTKNGFNVVYLTMYLLFDSYYLCGLYVTLKIYLHMMTENILNQSSMFYRLNKRGIFEPKRPFLYISRFNQYLRHYFCIIECFVKYLQMQKQN